MASKMYALVHNICDRVRSADIALSVVVGPILGNLKAAFAKLAKAQAKQSFSFAIVVGDLFGSGTSDEEVEELTSLLNGSLQVPLPTYFSTGDLPLPAAVIQRLEADQDVCANLIFLGRKGTLKTTEGIRIVYLGGRLMEERRSEPDNPSRFDPEFTVNDARGLRGANVAHILITNEFPEGVLKGSSKTIPEALKAMKGHQCIAELCVALKPRYHFSTCLQASFEREPFEQPADYQSSESTSVTRFESLAAYEHSSKENKWLSAFRLDPSAPVPPAGNLTPMPFDIATASTSRKRQALPDQNESYSRYRNGDHYEGQSTKRRRQTPAARLNECYFCLGRPEAQTHLVGSMGDNAYLTIPKGPLPTPSTFPLLGFPGHTLIIPYHHGESQPSGVARDQAEVQSEYVEMQRYRKAICQMLRIKGLGSLGAVCWEANRSGVRHQHWQMCPVPAEQVSSGLVEAAFKVDGENRKYPAFQACDTDLVLDQMTDYFRVWIWTPTLKASNPVEAADQASDVEGREKSMFLQVPSNQQFDIQFGRRVMAKILKLESRSDWRDAAQTEDSEKQDKDAFMEAFQPFDFSLAVD
jgi:hypothetical protein